MNFFQVDLFTSCTEPFPIETAVAVGVFRAIAAIPLVSGCSDGDVTGCADSLSVI